MKKTLWLFSHFKGLWTNGVVSITVGANKDFGDQYLKRFIYREYGVIIHEPLQIPSHRGMKQRFVDEEFYRRTPEDIVRILGEL
jgi:hypothetical protein